MRSLRTCWRKSSKGDMIEASVAINAIILYCDESLLNVRLGKNYRVVKEEQSMIQYFDFQKTSLNDLIFIKPFNAIDNRGCFTKDYSEKIFQENGILFKLKEIFYTTSKKGVLRGLHFQRNKQQAKLIRCIYGHIFDVVVDLRPKSTTFKKWIGFDLSSSNKNEILIPGGFAHGYLVLENSIVSYKCAEDFYGEYDDGIKFDDTELKIAWPYDMIGGKSNLILADKDKNLQSFREFIEKYGGLR